MRDFRLWKRRSRIGRAVRRITIEFQAGDAAETPEFVGPGGQRQVFKAAPGLAFQGDPPRRQMAEAGEMGGEGFRRERAVDGGWLDGGQGGHVGKSGKAESGKAESGKRKGGRRKTGGGTVEELKGRLEFRRTKRWKAFSLQSFSLSSGQPTEPSISSSMRRLSSTEYSIGNWLTRSLTNPLTARLIACAWVRPRDCM